MDIHTLVYLLLLAGFSGSVKEKMINLQSQNITDVLEEDSLLPIKERYRRLIPYMTYYLAQQPYTSSPQYETSSKQYNPVAVAVAKKVQPQYIPQYQQNTGQYQSYPSTILIGNPQQGYRRVPLYPNVVQPSYVPYSYTPQQPSDLSRVIAQNYLAIAKKVQTLPQIQSQTQAPQYTYKQYPAPQYTAASYKTISQVPKETYQPRYQIPNPVSSPKYTSNYVPQYTSTERPEIGSEYVLTQSHEIEVEEEKPTAAPLESIYQEPKDSLASDVLAGYQLTKTLPDRLTSSNIGSSIRTLSHILKLLQRVKVLPQAEVQEEEDEIEEEEEDYNSNKLTQNYPTTQTEGSTPGTAGVDYPALSEIPETSFSCKDQRYKGFFGDPETHCQVWHYCDLNGGQASFLCPNGTIFSQVALTCDWWFNVKCASTAQLYVLNERLYKYILPFKPSFPEDYAGPLVDQYLTNKFRELEAKRNKNETTVKDSDKENTNTLREILTDEIKDKVGREK